MNANAPDTDQRLHGLDALRAAAMLLGLVFHATIPFMQAPFVWVAREPAEGWSFDLLFTGLHSFRMPLFFLLAGFFSHLLRAGKGWAGFLKQRVLRIGLPFLLGMLTLVPLMIWIYLWRTDTRWPLGGPFTLWDLPTFHLWFLEVLLIFYAVAALMGLIGKSVPQAATALGAAVDWGLARVWPVALLMPATMACLWAGSPGGWLPDGQRLFPEPRVLFFYFQFFALGWLIHRSSTAGVVLQRKFRPYLGIGLAGLAGVLIVRIGSLSGTFHESLAVRLLGFAADTASAWFLSLGLIGACLALVKNHHPAIRYVADASYWIYLIHLPIMLFVQIEIHSWHIPIIVKFLATLITTTAIGFATYALFVRHTPIGTLLNGPRKRPSAAQTIGRY